MFVVNPVLKIWRRRWVSNIFMCLIRKIEDLIINFSCFFTFGMFDGYKLIFKGNVLCFFGGGGGGGGKRLK